jgi:gliding motility-associated-like protein
LEFSATASKVYVTDLDNRNLFGQTNSPNLFCYDFETAVISSWTLSNQTSCPGRDPQGLGQIEIGKDLKLYIPVINGCKLYVVDNADSNPVIEQIETSFILSAGISDHIKSEFLDEYSLREPVITADKSELVLCEKETINLEVDHDDPSTEFQWYFNDQPIQGAENNYLVAMNAGKYTVQVEDPFGCSLSSAPVIIQPAAVEPLNLGRDTVLCYNERLMLNVDVPGAVVVWGDGDSSPSREITASGKYSVTVEKDGCVYKDSISVEVISFDSWSIPNIITPNGDSYNEYFVLPMNFPHEVHLTIFNRWGAEVFSDPDYKNQWNSSALSEGVYYYEAKSECLNSKGWIHVFR